MQKNSARLAVAFLSLSALAGISYAGTRLVVEMDRLRDTEATVAVCVFASSSGFPNDPKKALACQKVIPHGDTTTVSFENIPPEIVAVSAYQDLNGNHRFDKNLFGIPREPAGVSNNAPAHFGPPSFSDSSFAVSGPEQKIQIHLRGPGSRSGK